MNWKDYDDFDQDEFLCRCCGQEAMVPEFMQRLQEFRSALGFPFVISSGYRCPNHNDSVSSTGRDGPHTTGRAVDIQVSGKHAVEIDDACRDFGFTGKGVKQKGNHAGRFIHLDDLGDDETKGPRPWLWSY